MKHRPIQLIVVEGLLEVPASLKMLRALKINTQGVQPIPKGGRGSFWRDIGRYNQAAICGPVLALTDLDTNPCSGGLIANRLKQRKHPDFILRVAEPMLESWILADQDGFSKFLKNIREATSPISG